jgi:hypothetical protein
MRLPLRPFRLGKKMAAVRGADWLEFDLCTEAFLSAKELHSA